MPKKTKIIKCLEIIRKELLEISLDNDFWI